MEVLKDVNIAKEFFTNRVANYMNIKRSEVSYIDNSHFMCQVKNFLFQEAPDFLSEHEARVRAIIAGTK